MSTGPNTTLSQPRHRKSPAIYKGLVLWNSLASADLAAAETLSWDTGDPDHTAAAGSIYIKLDATSIDDALWLNTDGGTTWESFGSQGTVIEDGGILSILGAGTGTGDVVERIGGSATEGLELRVYEETVSPAAVETNLIQLPANSRVLSVQSNVETALTGGGTTDSYGVGTAADPDKYGSSATLTQNSKSDYLGDGSVLTSAEQLVLTGTASETADGDTALTVGSVRVRVVYYALNSLDDAA